LHHHETITPDVCRPCVVRRDRLSGDDGARRGRSPVTDAFPAGGDVAASTAAIAVNGVTPPGEVSAGVGTNAAVSISDGPGNATDWVGLYASGAADGAVLSWRYLNGTTAAPASVWRRRL